MLLWFIYFFGYIEGRGNFHQVNHLVELFFSIVNAGLVLVSTSFFSWHYFNNRFTEKTKTASIEEIKDDDNYPPSIPLVFKNVYQQLNQLMQDGFYTETQLSIKQLANKLKMPEHQLRELINKYLGFRNFSDFLSSYRIPEACAQFEDITFIRKPILTITLELGYGSIATFNRTFKVQKGITPKEYRNKFQK